MIKPVLGFDKEGHLESRFCLASGTGRVAEQSTHNLMFEGSNPATVGTETEPSLT